MRIWWVAGGLVLLVVGLVWLFQGIGSIKGSFMTGSPVWTVIGGVAVLAGGLLIVRGSRARR